MQKVIHRYRKYFQPLPQDEKWGVYILGCGGYTSHYNDISDRGRTLTDYALVYVTEGQGNYFLTPQKKIPVEAGDMIILFPGVWHQYSPDTKKGWTQNWVIANGDYLESLHRQGFISMDNPVLKTGIDPDLHSMFYRIESLADREGAMFQQQAGAEVCRILAKTISLDQERDQRYKHPALKEIISYIENNWQEEIDFEYLAEENFISYPHLRRIFKKATGQSPLQFQLDIKINRAKILLENHHNSVKLVALELGFQNQYYFSRLFKQKTGVSPSEWRGV